MEEQKTAKNNNKESLNFLFEEDDGVEFLKKDDLVNEKDLAKTNKELYFYFKRLHEIYNNKENLNSREKVSCERQINLLIKIGGSKEEVRKLANAEAYAKISDIKKTSNDHDKIKGEKIIYGNFLGFVSEHFKELARKSFKSTTPSSQSDSKKVSNFSIHQKDDKTFNLRLTPPIESPRQRDLGFVRLEAKTSGKAGKIALNQTQAETQLASTTEQAGKIKMDFFKKKSPARRKKAPETPSSRTNVSFTSPILGETEKSSTTLKRNSAGYEGR